MKPSWPTVVVLSLLRILKKSRTILFSIEEKMNKLNKYYFSLHVSRWGHTRAMFEFVPVTRYQVPHVKFEVLHVCTGRNFLPDFYIVELRVWSDESNWLLECNSTDYTL
jgi:hypothetical protein